jgi:hypothetical protein
MKSYDAVNSYVIGIILLSIGIGAGYEISCGLMFLGLGFVIMPVIGILYKYILYIAKGNS